MASSSKYPYSTETTQGVVGWKAPSNIALVKYWGKKGPQLPSNPSVSFTLSKCLTETHIKWSVDPEKKSGPKIDLTFEGKEAPHFQQKIEKFLGTIVDVCPWLDWCHLKIEGHNTFPHSAGIASSASSMAALALCLCSIEQKLTGTLDEPRRFYEKASFLARLGSGSASRSIFPKAALWGDMSAFGGRDEYALPVSNIHQSFENFADAILIVSDAEKEVSSSAGHALMDQHPYRQIRFSRARENCHKVIKAIAEGDIKSFGEILEQEALELHALMMLSQPSFILMRPGTLSIIEKVRAYRKRSRLPVYFTLDAGPNIHLLYQEAYRPEVIRFIENELLEHCQDRRWIDDKMGTGPEQVR